MLQSCLTLPMILVKSLLIVLVVFQEVQSQGSPRTLWSCTVPLCASAPAGNGCGGATICYAFNTSSGSSICSPAPACSLFDVCTSSGSGCPSSKSVCVINSCCPSPVCLPSSLTDMCTVTTTTTTAATPAASTTAATSAASTTAAPTCVPLPGAATFSSYNLITLGSLSTSSDVDNRTIVCGSLVSGNSANFAIHINANSYPPASYSLEVNGQIASGNGIQVTAGSFGVGTNPAHTIVANGVVGYTLDGRTVNMNGGNQGATINVDANLTATCSSLTSNLQALSSTLAALTSTQGNNVTIPTSQSGPLNFYVNAIDANGMAVFNVVGNTVLNNQLVQQIQLNVGSNLNTSLQLVVINLSGTSITFAQGNLVGTWFTSISTGRAQTIWNLPQATSLTINNNWMGALLAPYATVTASVNIDGATAVQSLTTTAELHDPPIILPSCILNSAGTTATPTVQSTTTQSTTTSSVTTTTTQGVQCVAPPIGATYFSSYNLITLGSLSTSSDVENRTIVCGSLVSGNSANFAIHINANSYPPASYSLEINGQIASGNGIQVTAGSFGVGTNPAHTIVANGVVGYTLDGRTVNMNGGNQGATINVDANLTSKCTTITTGIQALSAFLAQLSNTTGNNVTIPTSQSGPLNLYVNTVNANGIAVFNLVGNTVLNNQLVQQIQLNVGSNLNTSLQLVVINLSGTSITFAQGNLVGTWFTSISTGRAQTIWNLPQATSLTINNNWMGALLAPYATVTASVNIDGATAVQSLTTTAELHDPPIIIPACF